MLAIFEGAEKFFVGAKNKFWGHIYLHYYAKMVFVSFKGKAQFFKRWQLPLGFQWKLTHIVNSVCCQTVGIYLLSKTVGVGKEDFGNYCLGSRYWTFE